MQLDTVVTRMRRDPVYSKALVACRKGDLESLVGCGDILRDDQVESTAILATACKYGKLNIIEHVLDYVPIYSEQQIALYSAAHAGHLPAVKYLLDKGADLRTCRGLGVQEISKLSSKKVSKHLKEVIEQEELYVLLSQYLEARQLPSFTKLVGQLQEGLYRSSILTDILKQEYSEEFLDVVIDKGWDLFDRDASFIVRCFVGGSSKINMLLRKIGIKDIPAGALDRCLFYALIRHVEDKVCLELIQAGARLSDRQQETVSTYTDKYINLLRHAVVKDI